MTEHNSQFGRDELLRFVVDNPALTADEVTRLETEESIDRQQLATMIGTAILDHERVPDNGFIVVVDSDARQQSIPGSRRLLRAEPGSAAERALQNLRAAQQTAALARQAPAPAFRPPRRYAASRLRRRGL